MKRFTRVPLKAGEPQTITFTLPFTELAFYDIDMRKTVESGDFNIWIGPHSQEGLQSVFAVE